MSDDEGVVKHNKFLDIFMDVSFATLSVATIAIVSQTSKLMMFLMCVAIVNICIRVTGWVSENGGRYISAKWLSHAPFNNPLKEKRMLRKLRSQSWQLTIHFSMAVISGYILSSEDWIQKPWNANAWGVITGIPNRAEIFDFYILQLAVWLVTCFYHRFMDAKSKDYYVMFAHHIATISVVVISYYGDQVRYGLLVFFYHDLSDVFLDLPKITNYFKLEDKHGFFITEILFVVLLFVWGTCRLYKFPELIYSIYLSSKFDQPYPDGTITFCEAVFKQQPDRYLIDCVLDASVCGALLVCLFFMHVYWTFLLLKVGYRGIVRQEKMNQAARAEYEGDVKKEH
jgi:ceramide synthetase